MVVIKRQIGSVANWWFEDENKPISDRASRTNLRETLEMCQSAGEVLQSYELLRPSRIIFSNWIDPDSASSHQILADEPAVTVPVPLDSEANQIVALCEKALEQLDARRNGTSLYPTTVDVLGTGIVFNAAGQRYEFPLVTWLEGTSHSRPAVEVNTQIDAWLPYTLLAEPQPEVYNYNWPRLAAALGEMQSRLEIIPVTDDSNKYALVNGLHLSNYMDDGEPMEVVHQPILQWFRHVLL